MRCLFLRQRILLFHLVSCEPSPKDPSRARSSSPRAGGVLAALRRELDLKDKEIARLKSVVAKLMPQETAGAYAKNKREKQVRAYERKRQQQASRDERAAARS